MKFSNLPIFNRLFFFLNIGFTFFCINGVRAQNTKTSADSLKLIELETVNVTVNRFEESTREQSIQIKRITKKTIEFQNAPTTADLLINSGDVFVQKSQAGGGSPVLRGFEASRVLLVVDGIRMNNAIYRSGHLQNVLRIEQSMLENAEIIFGPSSLIYGSDALGGVISFTTKKPKFDQLELNAFTRYGTASKEVTNHIDVNLGSQKWSSLTSITASNFGNTRQGNWRNEAYPDFGKRFFYQKRESLVTDLKVENSNPNVQVGSGYAQADFLQKIAFQPKSNQLHILNFQYSTSTNVLRYDRLSEIATNGDFRFAEWYYGPEKRLLSSYELQLKERRLFDNSNIIFAYQRINESRNSRRWGNDFLISQNEKVDVLSLNADFIKYHQNTTYQYGVEVIQNFVGSVAYRRNIVGGLNNAPKLPAATRYPDGGSTLQSNSAYVTVKNELIDSKLFINYGVRYSYTVLKSNFIDKTFFPFDFDSFIQKNGAIVGNVGLVFTSKPTQKLSFLFSNGYRVPNVDDLTKVFDSVAGQVVVPNPDIKPELTYNFEIGIAQQISKNMNFKTSIFYTVFDNIIVVRPFTLNGQSITNYQGVESKIFASQNAEKASLIGANASVIFAFAENWTLTSTYNLIRGRLNDQNETPLDHIPPNHGKTSLQYKKSKLQAEFFSLYNGWKRLENYSPSGEDNLIYATPEGMPAWWTLNLRTSFVINETFTLQTALENMLDKNYRYFASGFSAPGRNMIATLRVKI